MSKHGCDNLSITEDENLNVFSINQFAASAQGGDVEIRRCVVYSVTKIPNLKQSNLGLFYKMKNS